MKTPAIALVPLCVLSLLLLSTPAAAVPAFARQTNMACSTCHTIYPELTPFGRQFKANGYTMTTTKQVSAVEENEAGKRVLLELPAYVPLGVHMITSWTHTNTAQQVAAPGNPPALNDDVLFPDQWSFFYAGKVAPHLGAFVQLTYVGAEDHFGFDNTDIRYANTADVGGKPLTFGLTLNNNPTVSDLWNSSPAWNVFQAVSSSVAPTPAAGTQVEGALAGAVAGAGAYAMFDGFLYAEFDAYRSAPLGVPRPLDASTGATNINHGTIPYWRVTVEKDVNNQAFSIGTFGLYESSFPGGSTTDSAGNVTVHPLAGATNKYLDLAGDAQYQYLGDTNIFSAVASYVWEKQNLDATFPLGGSANPSNELDSLKLSASYLWNRTVGVRETYSQIWGSSDTSLYAPAPVSGSVTGSPRSTSFMTEVTYNPWYNVRLGLQYLAYARFNGGTTNYDGSGRNASGNNTLFGYLWFAF
jgi:hypothetical protein